jgi:hypothetical protein
MKGEKEMFKFKLGQEVKEVVTGYKGIIMVRSEYFTGCNHYGIQNKEITSEGKVKEWEYFDESRLVTTQTKEMFDREGMQPTSAPGNNPPMIG